MTSLLAKASARRHSPVIAIVDADRRVRRSLADLLSLGGVRVAGSAGDARETLRLLERGQPDLLLIDPQLPTAAAGAELLADIRLGWPELGVMLMGWHDGEGAALVDGQPAGYVSKSAPPPDFLRAIMRALPGGE